MENKEVIKRFYELLKEMFQEIEDIFNEEERIELSPYARKEMLLMMEENGIKNEMIVDFIDKELRRLGLLEARLSLSKELSNQLLNGE
jgi:hypothetical protein